MCYEYVTFHNNSILCCLRTLTEHVKIHTPVHCGSKGCGGYIDHQSSPPMLGLAKVKATWIDNE